MSSAEEPGLPRPIPGNPFILVPVVCVLILSGCMIGPDFRRPAAKVPTHWTGTAAPVAPEPPSSSEQALAKWWSVFNDPALTSLVDRAMRSNLDLKQAEVRILQARAARGIAGSNVWPNVDASGAFRRSRSSGTIGSQYEAGFDAGWELDIFGGLRREIEAAEADLQAAVEARRDVLVTLTAEVARNYIDLRAFQQRILIARQNLDAQLHSAKLTRQRFQGGFVGGLDVANAEAQVATTAAQIPLLESAAQQTVFNISVLLGSDPASLIDELALVSPIPVPAQIVALGVPSDLVRQRPDIRRAEAEIHAATARIGVAMADLFPKFTVTGSAGLRSSDLSSLFDWVNRFWSLGPSVVWPVFNMGRIRSNIELQKAYQAQNLVAYQQDILSALQEVENALVSSAKEREHREALVGAVTANRKAVKLATTLYTEGHTDFLNVLNAQRSLYLSEDALVQSTRTVSTNLVALYKALGGGWTDDSEEGGNADRDDHDTGAASK